MSHRISLWSALTVALLCSCAVNRVELRAVSTPNFPTPWHEPNGERATQVGQLQAQAPAPVASAPTSKPATSGKMLAVLTLKSDASTGLSSDHVTMLTDYVRQLAFKVAGQHEIMTTENMEVLLKSHGTTLAQCAEASCEVEFGQRIGADFVVSGGLSKLGSYLFLNLKAHDTAKGVLLAAETVKAKNVDGLVEGLDAAAFRLLQGL